MPVLLKLLHRFNLMLLNLTWIALVTVLLVHFFLSWWLLWMAGEHNIASPGVFWYFYMVTSTTVGYGDFSPTTTFGRAVVSFWVMPGGIALFAATIGKITQVIINLWRKHMQGYGDYSSLSDHVVIMGWHDNNTRIIVDQILGDKRRDQNENEIVLCSEKNIENPLPEHIKFVRGDLLTSSELLRRAGVQTASRIIIYCESDEITLATGLAISATQTPAHIVAHFQSDELSRLFKAHCPHAECTADLSLELIVRSAQDPGSSRIQSQLLSSLTGPTQFCVKVPESFSGCSYGKLFYALKENHNATAFGIANSQIGDDFELNPKIQTPISGGQYIYFMAPERIYDNEIEWETL